jgi:hypothetical protein
MKKNLTTSTLNVGRQSSLLRDSSLIRAVSMTITRTRRAAAAPERFARVLIQYDVREHAVGSRHRSCEACSHRDQRS